MFDRPENDFKMAQLAQEKTASQFGEQEDSIVYEVEAEKQYVSRLKNQRQKIEALYAKYDVLLKDLKSKDYQLKEKEKTINTLELKCKTLSFAHQESNIFKQQNNDIKSENVNLQKAIAQLEESYAYLHGQFRSKEAVTNQKYDQMEQLNDQLMNKLKAVTRRYQQREEEFDCKYRFLQHTLQEFRVQHKKQKDSLSDENETLKASVLQKDEEIKLLRTENQCVKQKITEMDAYISQLVFENQEKVEQLHKQKKCQVRVLKNELQNMKELNYTLQRKWQKLKEECELKDCSLKQMNILIEEHEKQNCQALHLIKHQFAQEKSTLKEQLIQAESHIQKLQRKVVQLTRKEQCLYGKIRKYQVCMDAKKNLRVVEQQQLDRINRLLNLP